MSINSDDRPAISRRVALRQACCGFGTLGLAGLLSQLSLAIQVPSKVVGRFALSMDFDSSSMRYFARSAKAQDGKRSR